MNTSRAVLAGALGGVAMSIVLFLGRTVMGMEMNLEMMMGTMFLAPGPAAWIAGFALHLMMSGLIALMYAWGFDNVTHKASAALGAAFGLPHLLIAGVVMGAAIPALHRYIPETMMAPGYFLANHGAMGVVAFVLLHVMFGAIVGALYAGHERHAR